MSSTFELSVMSPISRVPYDILREIFTHCLPRYPLRHRQPNTTIAPLLLCHVCSFWRMVALSSAPLWVHLSYRFTLVEEYNIASASWTYEFIKRDVEIIQWWRRNQGTIAPFLNFDVHKRHRYDISQKLIGDRMAFLVGYLTSAQYLELDMFYWGQIRERIEAGYQVVFPNLRTQITNLEWNDSFYEEQALLPNHTLPALRHLSINGGTPPDNFVLPDYWVTLTHVSLYRVLISSQFWFSLMHAVPNLQWGHFDITVSNIKYTTPSLYILQRLTTLLVTVADQPARQIVHPLSALFTNLYMPTLRTLSLSSPGAKSWATHRAITELYEVLKSTPAITKLVLGGNFLSLHNRNANRLFAATRGITPVWNHATELEHLQVDFPDTISMVRAEVEKALDIFARNIFSSDNIWLDLQHPLCPIRSFTISGASSRITDLMMSKIQRNAEKAPNFVFQITPDSAERIAAEVRNGWWSKI